MVGKHAEKDESVIEEIVAASACIYTDWNFAARGPGVSGRGTAGGGEGEGEVAGILLTILPRQ